MNIIFDYNKPCGKIRAMNGVGQPPLFGHQTKYFHYLKDANIPYSRLHDVGGYFGGFVYVDIPNIFRDFDADENLPESYDFTFTDWLIKSLYDNGCAPVYRLGVTIENDAEVKAYRVFPPKDFSKWARICEHIIRHYNEGFANGFEFGIKYWEIWNEPDVGYEICNTEMYQGSRQSFFELYRVAAKYLKGVFGDKIKIGGYGALALYNLTENHKAILADEGAQQSKKDDILYVQRGCTSFFYEFVDMVIKEKVPLDFFSYHCYSTPADIVERHRFIRNHLNSVGLYDVELHLNEWNSAYAVEERGKSVSSAKSMAVMCAMQKEDAKMLCYYDARIDCSPYGGMFNPMTCEPLCTYYSFAAFGKMLEMGTQIESGEDSESIYSLGAVGNSKISAVIVNIGADEEITTNLPEGMDVYMIDENHMLEKTELNYSKFIIPRNTVFYFEKSI